MIFQGQEFLESGWFDDHRGLDWQKARSNGGLVKLYHDLIHLRRNCDGVTRGLTGQKTQILLADNEQKLLVFQRSEFGGPGDDVVVVANFANVTREELPVPFPNAGLWKLRFNSDRQIYDPSFGGTTDKDVLANDEGAAVNIGPYGVLIYSMEG